MTTEFANYFWDLDNEYIGYKLQDFANIYGAKHTPSVLAVKSIAGYLGSRQRKRKGFDIEVTNESKAQIFAKTGWSEGSVGDVIKFLESMDLCKTISRGGGKNKLPTVRHMITTGHPIEFQSKQRGIIPVLNGKRTQHKGTTEEQNGELPDTPKDIPVVDPQCVYVHESFTSKNKQNKKQIQHTHIKDKSDLEVLVCAEETDRIYLELLLELNEPLHVQALIDESDKNFASLVGSLGGELHEDLDEYSFTPDDVKDVMARW